MPKTSPPQAPEEFEWVPTGSLRPWKDNPRDNTDTVPDVADSIKRFGWGRPLIVNRHPGLEGEIIVGHTALRAAQLLGETKVPVRWVSLPAAKAHALALADNRHGEKSKWDKEKLGAIATAGELEPADWMSAGFSEREVKANMFDPWPADASSTPLSYSIVIECSDEAQQTDLLTRFETEGLTCKPWVG